MNRVEYKGYIIHATPYKLAEDKGWFINLHIERHTGSGVTDRNFSAANTFPTEAEAIQHCFNFGMQIIDGKAEGFSVDDL
jgi:hypothetical protein